MTFLAIVVAVTLLSTTSTEESSAVETVAFTAAVTKNLNLTLDQIVVFDSVFTNQGNGYSNITGVFTAPQDGTYLFNFQVMSQKDKYCIVSLWRNEERLISAYASQTNRTDHSGNSIVLWTKTGDQVFLKSTDLLPSWIHGDSGKYTTFTGYRIGA